MADNTPNKAPDRFIRLLQKAMDEHPDKLSLNEVARRAGLSPAYLSFLLNGKRNVPSNAAITELERVLKIPPGDLNKAAGRPDDAALEFFRKEQAAPIMRTLAQLPSNKLSKAQALLDGLLGATDRKRK